MYVWLWNSVPLALTAFVKRKLLFGLYMRELSDMLGKIIADYAREEIPHMNSDSLDSRWYMRACLPSSKHESPTLCDWQMPGVLNKKSLRWYRQTNGPYSSLAIDLQKSPRPQGSEGSGPASGVTPSVYKAQHAAIETKPIVERLKRVPHPGKKQKGCYLSSASAA